MIGESPLGYSLICDPKYSQTYIDAMKMAPTSNDRYNIQYHHSIIDSDNVNDSIKVKILYNELMTVSAALRDTERRLMGEINCLNNDHRRLVEENKRLSDEVASIKQSLYFG